jgi:hypothetical protein
MIISTDDTAQSTVSLSPRAVPLWDAGRITLQPAMHGNSGLQVYAEYSALLSSLHEGFQCTSRELLRTTALQRSIPINHLIHLFGKSKIKNLL